MSDTQSHVQGFSVNDYNSFLDAVEDVIAFIDECIEDEDFVGASLDLCGQTVTLRNQLHVNKLSDLLRSSSEDTPVTLCNGTIRVTTSRSVYVEQPKTTIADVNFIFEGRGAAFHDVGFYPFKLAIGAELTMQRVRVECSGDINKVFLVKAHDNWLSLEDCHVTVQSAKSKAYAMKVSWAYMHAAWTSCGCSMYADCLPCMQVGPHDVSRWQQTTLSTSNALIQFLVCMVTVRRSKLQAQGTTQNYLISTATGM